MPSARTIEKADLFRLKFITSSDLSPDGTQVVYAVSKVDPEQEKEFSSLWLLDIASGQSRELTDGTAVDSAPKWSPDGTQIAFLSTRKDDKAQIHVIPAAGGDARALTSFAQGVAGGPVWSPDATRIAFTSVPDAEPRDPDKPYRIDRTVYRFDAMEYLDDVVQSLYVMDSSGGRLRRLTDDRCMNADPQWSPDGTKILISTSMDPHESVVMYPRPRIVDVATGAVREVTKGWGHARSLTWSADGSKVLVVGQPEGKPAGSKNDLWVFDPDGGTPQNRSAGFEIGIGGALSGDMPIFMYDSKPKVTADGAYAHLPVQIGGECGIYRIALDGPESVERVISGERCVSLHGMNAEHMVFVASGINHPIDLYVSRLDGSEERQLTHLNDELLSSVRLPGVEHLLFPGTDGTQVEGWLLTPAEGQAPYPTILYIHGGPHAAYGHIFHFDSQVLAGAGYAVLLINHRASTGYGDAFSTAITGDWGNLDYGDLMSGVDHVIERGQADGDRLGVCGLSGGGNLTTWIIGHTDRFKAAVPENPVTNWHSFYGVSDIGLWFALQEMGGHPWEIPDVYTKCSPITYAHNCTTPTLMVQGEHDWRCPPEQTEQFYARLKAVGCTAEMLRLPKSAHGGTHNGAVAVRAAHNDALLDWMNRYVLGEGSTS